MEKTTGIKHQTILILKGLAMGAANKVPGVSGGVVAFVAGFYEEFIYSLQRFNAHAFKLLLKKEFSAFFKYVNGKFLSLLFLGMLISYFSVSKVLDYWIKHHEIYVWSVFFGMIIGSIFYIAKDFKDWKITTYTAVAIGIILGVGISFLDPATENDNLFFVFLCGIISVSGMTLPGFSGSFILILLGNYVLLLVDAVNALFDTVYELISGDFSFYQDLYRVKMLKILVVFTLGSLVGLVTFSHALNYILKHYKSVTTASILGFIIGSLGVVWPFKFAIFKTDELKNTLVDSKGHPIILNYERYLPEFNSETALALVFIIIGVLIVMGLGYAELKLKPTMNNFGLIGKDISYSYSESFFTEKFQNSEIKNTFYKTFDIENLDDIKEMIIRESLKGLNVTIPYKQDILPYLDQLNSTSAQIGAVNCIKVMKNGSLKGYNTDYYGFKDSLKPHLLKHHTHALILGTGGASKAVAYALDRLDIKYKFVSRKPSNGQLSYENINVDMILKHTLIINCTPLGTYPNINACPNIPYFNITRRHILYDLIYNPEETTFLAKGKSQGATTINGGEMLRIQAEKSWDIWNR
jgi:putative membrane protein